MAIINKKVILDYFGSFFKQYSTGLTKESFDKIRDIVNEAQCGCCNATTIYWSFEGSSDNVPNTHQVNFYDANDVLLAQTSLNGGSPQVVCVPSTVASMCVDVITSLTGGTGSITVQASNGTTDAVADSVGENCFVPDINGAAVYFINVADDGI